MCSTGSFQNRWLKSIIFCHLMHIRSGKTGNLFSFNILQFMVSANSRIRFSLQIVLVCLYSTPSLYHQCAKLSEDIELIKCLSDIFVECVSKIKHILSVIHYTIHYIICGDVCFQFTHSPCDDWENIYILRLIIIIKSEVWTITHCLGLGHETMVCAVCLSIFLSLWRLLENLLHAFDCIWFHNSFLHFLPTVNVTFVTCCL